MKFVADFHVHSRFSRATAKNLDLENLYIAAQLKGITVIGTGDLPIQDGLPKSKRNWYRLNRECSS